MADEKGKHEDPLADAAHTQGERHRRFLLEGEPSVSRRLAQIGVLGWMIVVPMLLGLFIGRWIDGRFEMGLFWTAALMMVGLVIGCWSAWRWVNNS